MFAVYSCEKFNELVLKNDTISDFDFYDFNLYFHGLINKTFIRCTFHKIRFCDSIISNCKFIDCIFLGCHMGNYNIGNKTTFEETDLSGLHTYKNFFIDGSTLELNEFPLKCPEKGEFIGYKKCFTPVIDASERITFGVEPYLIVKLLIPAEAKRSSAFSNKCRCSKAKTLEILDLEGKPAGVSIAVSGFDVLHNPLLTHPSNIYKIGEWTYPDSFDENRFIECSHGLHFFMTFDEARRYYS